MTEKEMLVALLNLVGNLAMRLTGEIPVVCVQSSDGSWLHIQPDSSYVTWHPVGAASLGGLDGELPAMHCSLHG